MPIEFTLHGPPRTKKNSGAIIPPKGARLHSIIVPSADFRAWEKRVLPQLALFRSKHAPLPVLVPVNLRATIYRDRAVGDIGNYLAAICDVLEKSKIVENDRLIMSFDGSRLRKDGANPRVEIVLTKYLNEVPERFLQALDVPQKSSQLLLEEEF